MNVLKAPLELHISQSINTVWHLETANSVIMSKVL